VHNEVNEAMKQAEIIAFPTTFLLIFIFENYLFANASSYVEKITS